MGPCIPARRFLSERLAIRSPRVILDSILIHRLMDMCPNLDDPGSSGGDSPLLGP